MATFYADEDTPASLIVALTALGHDVLTAAADNRANQRIPDADVLARAIAIGRTVLTFNRWDFHRLHRSTPAHAESSPALMIRTVQGSPSGSIRRFDHTRASRGN